MTKEFERAGIPTALISTIVPLAQSVGANRIIAGKSIPHPLGDPSLPPDEEKDLRRRMVRTALNALQVDSDEQLVFQTPPAS